MTELEQMEEYLDQAVSMLLNKYLTSYQDMSEVDDEVYEIVDILHDLDMDLINFKVEYYNGRFVIVDITYRHVSGKVESVQL